MMMIWDWRHGGRRHFISIIKAISNLIVTWLWGILKFDTRLECNFPSFQSVRAFFQLIYSAIQMLSYWCWSVIVVRFWWPLSAFYEFNFVKCVLSHSSHSFLPRTKHTRSLTTDLLKPQFNNQTPTSSCLLDFSRVSRKKKLF